MSAEAVLRRAAALMRERAEAATPEPWVIEKTSSHMDPETCGMEIERWRGYRNMVGFGEDRPTAEHIASWHPAVALAVADWLDQCAVVIDGLDQAGSGQVVPPGCYAVASAYLGESA